MRMKYCKKCVQPDTRPGIEFDGEGICPACRFMEKWPEIDWEARRNELNKLAEYGKSKNVSGYDCIIGVSGGKDSTRQALFVREELGLNPLLVCCSYPPEQLTERGAHNISNLISLGFDTIIDAPAPQTWKKLMREGFRRYGNWCKSTELALYASAPRVAIAYHIPLIFLGENPAIQLGDLNVGSITDDANRMKYCNTLGGGAIDWLLADGITEKDIIPYQYPSDEEMGWGNLVIRYLGYYWSDFTKVDNAAYSIARGLDLRTDPSEDTGHIWGFQALDDDFVVVNQFIKYVKFGFGQVTDEVCEQIRFGRMSRQHGIELVKKYDGKCAKRYIEAFCNYIEISEEEFWTTVESYRSKEIWAKDSNGEWVLRIPLE